MIKDKLLEAVMRLPSRSVILDDVHDDGYPGATGVGGILRIDHEKHIVVLVNGDAEIPFSTLTATEQYAIVRKALWDYRTELLRIMSEDVIANFCVDLKTVLSIENGLCGLTRRSVAASGVHEVLRFRLEGWRWCGEEKALLLRFDPEQCDGGGILPFIETTDEFLGGSVCGGMSVSSMLIDAEHSTDERIVVKCVLSDGSEVECVSADDEFDVDHEAAGHKIYPYLVTDDAVVCFENWTVAFNETQRNEPWWEDTLLRSLNDESGAGAADLLKKEEGVLMATYSVIGDRLDVVVKRGVLGSGLDGALIKSMHVTFLTDCGYYVVEGRTSGSSFRGIGLFDEVAYSEEAARGFVGDGFDVYYQKMPDIVKTLIRVFDESGRDVPHVFFENC